MGKLEALRLRFDENARHGAADGTESEDGDTQGMRSAGFWRLRGGRCKRRYGTGHSRHLTFECFAPMVLRRRDTSR